MIQKRKKVNSSKINLIISAVFHSLLAFGVFYFAAREGYLGKKLHDITVVKVTEKKPEPPKEKPAEPKVEQPKQEIKTAVPQARMEAAAPPPAATAAPEAAPAASAAPDINFSDGAIAVDSLSPNDVYKTLVEHMLHNYWNRPEDMADDNFVAEVELTVDKSGDVQDWRWVTRSGNDRWDQSVKDAMTQLKSIGKAPPKSFPRQFVVRFDVQSEQTEPIQFGIR